MLNFLTFDQLDYQCLKQARLSDGIIQPQTRINHINSKLMKMYGLLDGINDPFYNRTTTFSTPTTDQEYLKDFTLNGGVVTAINSTLKTITRSSGVFVAGQIIIVSYTPQDGIGGEVTNQWIGRITTGGAIAVYAVVSGTDATLSATIGASVVVIKSMSATSIDVSGIYFKDFTSIYDDKYTSTPGQIRVFDKIADSRLFFNLSLDVYSEKRVAWYQQGDTIHLFAGSLAIALGTVKCDYRGKPTIFTANNGSSLIDFPPEQNQALIDEIVVSYLIEAKQPVPENLQVRVDSYEAKFYAASESNKKSIEEKKNK
jgi:hypothetical protein